MIQKILYAGMFFISAFLFVITRVLYGLKQKSVKWAGKLRHLSILRKDKTRKQFIQYFKNKGYQKRVIKFVYRKVQEYINAADLVLLPEDDFRIVYEVDEAEWSYSLMDWFEELRRPFPCMEYFLYLNEKYHKVNFEYLMELFDPREKQISANSGI
ncbi:MAG: hypothetical protein ACJ75J_10550 [Cytophagaceae bacterium]